MAESIVSPGVFMRENDISFIQPAPRAAGAAIIGPTVRGPVLVPTVVNSYGDYTKTFGITFESGSSSHEYLTSIAVKNYFQQGGSSVLVTRLVSGSFSPASSTFIENSQTSLSGTLNTGTDILLSAVSGTFNISGSTAGIKTGVTASGSNVTASVRLASATTISHITVTGQSGSFYAGQKITFTSQSLGATAAGGTNLTFQLTEDSIITGTSPFILKTIGEGAIYNNSSAEKDPGAENSDGSLVSGSTDNIRWEISNVDSARGTFTLSIRQGSDNSKNKDYLETFNNLSLDPNSPNYIARIIGTQYMDYSEDDQMLAVVGEYVNRSKYVRVDAVNTPTINYLGTDGKTINLSGSISYDKFLPHIGSGSFYGALGNLPATVNLGDRISQDNTQGLKVTDYENILNLLENRDDYQFNVISAPGIINAYHPTVVDRLISLAETRGDCIAVVDLSAKAANLSNVVEQADTLNSSYAASYWPWLQMQTASGKLIWAPPSIAIPGVYVFTDNSTAPWFAPAGMVRGGLTGVIQAERKLSKVNRDFLYSKKVNPIASFPGSGLTIFGQKTLQTKASALDRVNVRRLLITLKKFIGDQAKNLVFEQNTVSTRTKFLNKINPYLESVVQRQGLYGYRVVLDETLNTADVIDRNELRGKIIIQPTKTIEYVILDFTIEPTGASFEG